MVPRSTIVLRKGARKMCPTKRRTLPKSAEELREAILDKCTSEYDALAVQYKEDWKALLEAIKNV